MRAVVRHGGLVVGAFHVDEYGAEEIVGFVFGFPALEHDLPEPILSFCSHMLAVIPAHRGKGLSFRLKRAQWQMVRHQEIGHITWTYDPLLSRNAHLNISRLGAVCNRYLRNYYGEMRDGLNLGLESDRFEVDWWLNSKRVNRRLSYDARPPLHRRDFEAVQAEILNPAQFNEDGWPVPPSEPDSVPAYQEKMCLVEIPADFQAMRRIAPDLARAWRLQTRHLFETLFQAGYLVTDFIHEAGETPRSFYVLSHGEATL
jgi:predicted GNAT superfamily acetyltransferase